MKILIFSFSYSTNITTYRIRFPCAFYLLLSATAAANVIFFHIEASIESLISIRLSCCTFGRRCASKFFAQILWNLVSSRLAIYIISIIHVQLTLYVRWHFSKARQISNDISSYVLFKTNWIREIFPDFGNIRKYRSWTRNICSRKMLRYITRIPRVEHRDLFHSRHGVNLQENRLYFVRRDRIFIYGKLKIYSQF